MCFKPLKRIVEKQKKKRYEAERQSLEIEKLKNELAIEKSKTKDMRDKILQEAREEARNILRNAKEESELIISELRDISFEIDKDKTRRMHEAQQMLKSEIDKADELLVKDVLNVKAKKPPKNLKVGETVEVLSLNQVGEVLTLPDEGGNVTVQVGIMKANVHVSTLRRTVSEESNKSHFKAKTIMSSKSQTIRNEIDLRGGKI